MREEILEEQRALVERVEANGWEVTEAEVSVYQSPWLDEETPEATVVITARKPFPSDGRRDFSDWR